MSKPWVVGWGNGLSGPTTASFGAVFCGGSDWKYIPISYGQETIAIVPQQVGVNGLLLMEDHARLIAAAPDLLEAIQEMMEYAGIIEERCDSIATNKARAAIKKATE